MREIVFRGKRIDDYVNDKSIDYAEKDDREWVYGDIIHRRYYKNTDVVVIRTEDSGFDNYSDYEVDPDTVGQFTGLTDKNGKKIFEGDIVEFRTSLKKYYAKVYYKKGMWSLYIKGFNDRYMLSVAVENDYSVKVIGNIYDNPELLEVTE